jgi:hypothetical protein
MLHLGDGNLLELGSQFAEIGILKFIMLRHVLRDGCQLSGSGLI